MEGSNVTRIVFAAALLVAAGCASSRSIIGDPYFAKVKSKANVYARQGQSGVLKIAVMPFKASTELIGSSVSDIVVTELLRTQKYSLVERGQMSKVLSETELAMAGLSEAKAVEAARMLGAEAVVIGTVDEYGTQAKNGDTYAVVGLAIRLIDCASCKIIWSADLSKMARDDDTPLSTHARDVVHELIAGLYKNLMGQAGNLPPPPPSGIEVGEMGLREAVVRWTAPSYPAKYRIERAVDAEGPFAVVAEVDATAGRYVDRSGLVDSAVYYYRLSGVGKSGIASDPSPAVETMTAPPPDPPREVAATAPSSRCIRISWSPPGSEGVEKYRVERAVADGGDWRTVETSATTIFVDGGFAGCDIADSTRYLYRVVAINRVGAESAASKEVEVVSLPPPAVITGFSCKANEVRCVPISWNRSAEDDVIGYELERADSPTGPFEQIEKFKSAGTTQFLDGKRDPGKLEDAHAYSYRIRSFNKVGAFSAWTKAVTAKTRLPPPAPEGVEAGQKMPRSSRITWDESPDEKVVGYEVERSEEGSGDWKEIAETEGRGATSVHDRAGASESAPTGKLKDGTAYLYRVRAVKDGAGGNEARAKDAVGREDHGRRSRHCEGRVERKPRKRHRRIRRRGVLPRRVVLEDPLEGQQGMFRRRDWARQRRRARLPREGNRREHARKRVVCGDARIVPPHPRPAERAQGGVRGRRGEGLVRAAARRDEVVQRLSQEVRGARAHQVGRGA